MIIVQHISVAFHLPEDMAQLKAFVAREDMSKWRQLTAGDVVSYSKHEIAIEKWEGKE